MFSGVDLFRRSALRNALALSAIFIVVLALCGLWLVSEIRSEVRDDIDERLAYTHKEISTVPVGEIRAWLTDQDELALFTESLRTPDGEVLGALKANVFDTRGFQTLSADDLFQTHFASSIDLFADNIAEFSEFDEAPDIDTWRVFVGPSSGGDLAVFEPISGIEDALTLIPRVVTTVGIALVLTTLVAGVLVARQQQSRLDRIRNGIARIGRGDLSHPIAPEQPRDDLDEIMIGIDAAASELDGSISRLRLFSQNVAHELRTPLARLRATLEATNDVPQAALDRTDDVIRTLDSVQRIARLSHRPDPGTLSAVSLRDVVTLCEDLFAEVATENGQRLQVVLEEPAVVLGDHQLLSQMLANLVENAIRYAGKGAEITIRADGRNLSVHDTGPGFTDEQDMTEPFARASNARNKGGTGLGLALVKTIAQYHGAVLTLRSQDGLHAEVSFPTETQS